MCVCVCFLLVLVFSLQHYVNKGCCCAFLVLEKEGSTCLSTAASWSGKVC